MADNQNYHVGTVEITLKTQMDEASKKASSVLLQLNKLKNGVKDTKREIVSTSKSSKDLGSSLKKAFDVGKAYVALNYIRRYARVLTRAFKLSIDYTETLNKFEVSMDRMFNKAVRFQNQLNEAFGVSKSELMDYQANFNNIVKAMGDVTDEQAYNLSEKLTEMALDFASLFNTSTEAAMSKFQAALTQQVRPIRSVSGFDITQSTMGGVLKQIGITDRTVQQLSQVEKRLLTIITLQRQMEAIGARGDLARTIEQPANQLKVMQQTLKDLAITFGNFVMHDLAPAFKYINGLLMALKEIFQYMYTMIPKATETTPNGSLDDILKPEKATEGIKGAEKAVKDLKKATVGIDELNIIAPQTTDGGGGVGGIGGVDPRLLQALKDYDNQMEKTKMKATEIRDRIMEWLGFTKIIDEETGEVNFELEDGYTNFEKIRDILIFISIIIGFIVSLKVFSSAVDGVLKLTKHLNLFSTTTMGAVTISILSAILVGLSFLTTLDALGKLLDGDLSNDMEGFIELIVGTGGLVASVIVLRYFLMGGRGLIGLLTLTNLKFIFLGVTIAAVIGGVILLVKNWDKMNNMERTVGVIGAVTAAILGLAVAFGAFHSAWSLGLAVAGIIGGITAVVASTRRAMKDVNNDIKVKAPFTESSYASAVSEFAGENREFEMPSRQDYKIRGESEMQSYVESLNSSNMQTDATKMFDKLSSDVNKSNNEQNRLLQEQNACLNKLLAKDSNTYLDGRKVSNQLKKTEEERGYNAVVGGFAYG